MKAMSQTIWRYLGRNDFEGFEKSRKFSRYFRKRHQKISWLKIGNIR